MSSMKQPLIAADGNDETQMKTFHSSSLYLGLFVGVFIQASTLGANYLLITLDSDDWLMNEKNILYFSLFWSMITSAMAILILGILRSLVRFSSGLSAEAVEETILNMECRFVVGALVGVCSAWAITDAVMGLSVQIVYSLVTLAVALAWCRVMMWFFSPSKVEQEEETPEVLSIA